MIRIIVYIVLSIIILIFVWFSLAFRSKPYKALYLKLKDTKKIDKEEYPHFGFWLYTGLGSSGKSISMVEFAKKQKEKYPNLYIASGIKSLTFADIYLDHWQQVIDIRNPKGDKYGVLILFDEIQLTLNSQKWKSAPENLLEYVSQQRKLYKHIIASSQVFNRVNVILREQSNYIIECRSLVGKRWIFNSAFDTATYNLNGDKKDEGQKKRKRAWKYNFVATDEIRNLYDTYETQINLYREKQTKDTTTNT